jgi:membrane fusion protein (multidrug efflux system)
MSKKVCKVKQGLLLLGCLVAAVGCKQAPPTQMETGYEVMTVSPTDRMISSAYSAGSALWATISKFQTAL